VEQVVPAVALDQVKQQQRSADRAGLHAGAARDRDHQVGRRHQLGHPVGEAEDQNVGPPPGHAAQLALEPVVVSRNRKHGEVCGGKSVRDVRERPPAHASGYEQDAPLLFGYAQADPRRALSGRPVELGTDGRRNDDDASLRLEPVHGRFSCR
jgi:hypothetical protein